MKILGIDPGSSRTGYGLISDQPLFLIASGVIDVKEKNSHKKIIKLAAQYEKILEKFKPDLVAIEKLFFSRNVKTALEVSQARGVLIYLTLKNKIALTMLLSIRVKILFVFMS